MVNFSFLTMFIGIITKEACYTRCITPQCITSLRSPSLRHEVTTFFEMSQRWPAVGNTAQGFYPIPDEGVPLDQLALTKKTFSMENQHFFPTLLEKSGSYKI